MRRFGPRDAERNRRVWVRTLRIVGLALVLCLLVGGTAFALGTFKTGKYLGKKTTTTSKGAFRYHHDIAFIVSKTRVTRLAWRLERAQGCSDGSGFLLKSHFVRSTPSGPRRARFRNTKMKIKRGKFAGRGVYRQTNPFVLKARFTISGRLKGKKARGSLRLTWALKPPGSPYVTCDSRRQAWSAQRVR
jgi:hypothetical protein